MHLTFRQREQNFWILQLLLNIPLENLAELHPIKSNKRHSDQAGCPSCLRFIIQQVTSFDSGFNPILHTIFVLKGSYKSLAAMAL